MSDRIRAALQRLTELEGHTLVDCTADWAEAMIMARAALAEPVGEGVTDEELLELAQHHSVSYTLSDGSVVYPLQEGCDMRDDVLSFARAVLARFGHQPAPSAAGEPSDENCWQWYTYCPEEGLEMYSDRKQAQSAAQSIMGSYEVAAHSDGWHEDMESVSWGMLVPVEQAQVVERKTADPDSEFDEWVKYELKPARYGHQPAPSAEGEVGELVEYLRNEADYQGISVKRPSTAEKLTRAADLLERLAAPPAEGVNHV